MLEYTYPPIKRFLCVEICSSFAGIRDLMAQKQQKFPRLSKAPIIMAILEIKFAPREGINISDLKSLKGVFEDAYPNSLEINNAEIKFSAGEGKTPISIRNTGVTGFSFTSKDKKHEFYVTLNSFNFKQHSKYDTWEDFKSIALQAWGKCAEVVQPLNASRVSVRYINSIEIPVTSQGRSNAQQFFKTFIANTGSVVKTKPISNYFLRYTHPPGEDNIQIHFAQELKIGQPGKFPFIIDIDVIYETQPFPADFRFISNKLDELRDVKNEYFFDNLSDYTFNIIK